MSIRITSGSSDSESNYEPAGCQFTGIWKEIELGKEVSCGVYKRKCIHCNEEFKCVKPTKTRAHITHEFEDYTIPTHLEIKSFKSMDHQKKSKHIKLSEIHKTKIDEALIAAFVSCDSTNTVINDLELEIKIFINFNSLIFKSYNNNNDDLIKNENFESNVIEIHKDYDPKTIIQDMKFDKV
ncbi:9447_t:CDS:2 [Cetraspora pellucida]|uniref:9447_t:CDS:1 n=1 Tax=Cetraspora pellucida TaxID=1433469 RepID=A0A9N9FNJ2_9GLOM|nr:9447_t:CDS:2 [Cetraspora pellucida]